MQSDFQYFVGIDWGSEKHRVCLMDRAGRIIEERWVEHSGNSLAELADWLRRQSFESPSALAAAIEVPRRAVVKTLLSKSPTRCNGVFCLRSHFRFDFMVRTLELTRGPEVVR